MKEFNLEEFKKNPNQKVVTRDGREVRIVCTDFKNSSYPIITLVRKNKDEEVIMYYQKSGKDTYHPNIDLFFAPIKSEGWINIFKDEDLPFINGDIYESKNKAEEEAIGEPDYIATIKIEWEE